MNSPDIKIEQLRNKWKEGSKSQNSLGSENSFYHLAHPETILKRFSIVLRCGRHISFPYSALPIIEYEAGLLKIMASGWQIEIKGRNLINLMDEFNLEKVVWVKESLTYIDTKDQDIYISEIKISGMIFDKIDDSN